MLGGSPATHRRSGESFGLPLFLAAMSRALGLAIEDVVATGLILASGDVRAVHGVAAKVRAACAHADAQDIPALRFLVPELNETDALGAKRPGDTVVAVRNVQGALQACWPEEGFEDALTAHLSQRLSPSIDHLYELVVDGAHGFAPWRMIAQVADRLALLCDDDPQRRWEAQVAAAIAARHAGAPRALPPGSLERIAEIPSRAFAMALMAHVIQGVADAGHDWVGVAGVAPTMLAEPEAGGVEGARLHGAMGRLYAAWHEWGRARHHLHRALVGWAENRRHHEATHALCELLRVEGMAGHVDGVVALEAWVQRCKDSARLTPDSAEYLDLAIGRAYVQLGEAARATPWLSSTATNMVDSLLRWRAIGGDADALSALCRRDPDGEDRALVELARGSGDPRWRMALQPAEDVARLGRLGVTAGPDIARYWRY